MAESRLERFRTLPEVREAEGALILDPINVGYLSGFTGSTAALLITPEAAVLVTDSRYAVQAARECPGWSLVVTPSGTTYADTIAAEATRLGVRSLALEADYVTLAQFDRLRAKLPEVELKPCSGLVIPLRRVKDPEELARIRQACDLADRAFARLLEMLRPGVSEREIAIELDHWLRKAGSEKEAFDTIVASGWRSALPHGVASDKLLEPGDLVTVDFGARVHGYHSDLTRTVVLGQATERQREVYHVVLEAQRAALAAIRAGVDGREIDAVARNLIRERGFGDYFGHGLGHGLGRSVHDHPALSQHQEVILEADMVITVEPGIYIEGWGGVRIEDDVRVTADGCEVLTHAPKELIEIPV